MYRYKLASVKECKKQRCPSCGHSQKFVRYIDLESGDLLDEQYGKCDREENCGYWLKPQQKPFENKETVKVLQEEIKTSYISYKSFVRTFNCQFEDNFTKFLLSVFNEQDVIRTIDMYKVGCSDKFGGNSTTFWQIDIEGKIRTGKTISYNPEIGKRVKEDGTSKIGWMHSGIKDFNLKQCFFGEHILIKRKIKDIIIVEAEKTAVIMAIVFPHKTILSCGQLNGISVDKMNVLKDYNITLLPDKGKGYEVWSEKVKELKKFGFSIKISDFCEKEKSLQAGDDYADYVLKNIKQTELR
jgi:hypothetical protein